jgi:hypothetical protein
VVNVFSYPIHAQTDSSLSCFPLALFIFCHRLTVTFPKLAVILRPLYCSHYYNYYGCCSLITGFLFNGTCLEAMVKPNTQATSLRL